MSTPKVCQPRFWYVHIMKQINSYFNQSRCLHSHRVGSCVTHTICALCVSKHNHSNSLCSECLQNAGDLYFVLDPVTSCVDANRTKAAAALLTCCSRYAFCIHTLYCMLQPHSDGYFYNYLCLFKLRKAVLLSQQCKSKCYERLCYFLVQYGKISKL